MIVTVTLNPSLDRAIDIESLSRGSVLRATGPARIDPGGKGVNVSRALLANGVPSVAVIPCGGADGVELVELLHAEKVELRAVPIAGRTRSNITLAEPDGTITKVNEAGPVMSADEFASVTEQVLASAANARWVVACGRMPPGLSVGAFSRLCARVTGAGVRLAVDTSGPALLAAAEAGAALLKPNREELAEATGARIATFGDVVEAAERLRARGAGAVLASLGADGAVLVDADGIVVGDSPVSVPRSSVGAGDALLAGFLAHGGGGAGALAEALAWGAAAVGLPGSRMPTPEDLVRDRVRIDSHPDPDRPLLAPE